MEYTGGTDDTTTVLETGAAELEAGGVYGEDPYVGMPLLLETGATELEAGGA